MDVTRKMLEGYRPSSTHCVPWASSETDVADQIWSLTKSPYIEIGPTSPEHMEPIAWLGSHWYGSAGKKLTRFHEASEAVIPLGES